MLRRGNAFGAAVPTMPPEPSAVDRLAQAMMDKAKQAGGAVSDFYQQGGLAGLLGMQPADRQIMANERQVDALRQQGAPLVDQLMAKADNPLAMALGTENVAKAGRAVGKAFGSDEWYRGVSGDHPLRENTMWTTDPNQAGRYSQGSALTNTGEAANVMPAKMAKDMKGRSIDEEIIDALMDDMAPDAVAAQIMKDEGLDYVEFYHPNAGSDGEHLVRVVGNPENIQSRFVDPLPLDEASRMARAKGMGFDLNETMYSGRGTDFAEFSPTPPKRAAGGDNEAASWFTPDPALASHFADIASADDVVGSVFNGANVVPALIKPGKQKVVTVPFYNSDLFSAIIREAKEQGYDTIRFKRVDEGLRGIGPSDQIAVLNPANIRSKFAKFDPSKKGSADLLAGVAGAGLLGASVVGSGQQDKY